MTKQQLKAQRLREWRAKDPEGHRAKARAYYAANKLKLARWRTSPQGRAYKRRYVLAQFGLTIEQYNQMYQAQGGNCALCLKPETAKTSAGEIRTLNVDHCHVTGRVRGLLCRNCNVALGLVGDDIPLLERAIVYLCNTNPQQP